MEEWKEYKLGEVCDLIPGFAFKSKDFGDYKTKAIKIKDIKPPFVDFDGADGVCVDEYDVFKLKKYMVKKGDFILAMTGATIGKIGKYINNTPSYLNQRVLRFAPKDIVDKNFIYYFLSTPHFQKFIINHVDSESAQPNISGNTIGRYSIRLPQKETQHRIASILKSLDDKIEVNRRINDNFYFAFFEVMLIWLLTSLENDNLEQQAQALFKSWFVDFEPFKDGEFVESELGIIPKGWKAGSLEDITTQKAERVGDRVDMKVLSPVTSGQLMLSEEYFTKQVFSESIAKYKVVEIGDFAYNPARVNIGSLGRNNYDFNGCVSPVYVVFSCKDGYAHLFDLYRKTEKFKSEVNLRAIGGVRQSLNYKDFAFIQCIIPPLYVVEEFNAIYGHILVKQKYIGEENDRLASLRDTLLPRLMSGELKVEDVTL